jgi:hypothetical protein
LQGHIGTLFENLSPDSILSKLICKWKEEIGYPITTMIDLGNPYITIGFICKQVPYRCQPASSVTEDPGQLDEIYTQIGAVSSGNRVTRLPEEHTPHRLEINYSS